MNKYFSEDYRVTKDAPEELVETVSGAGGGGCFPAGTFIRTAFGYKPIEKCYYGEEVVCYDRFGVVEIGYITALHTHEQGTFEDDIYFIYSNGASLFPNGITGNHAVYDFISKEHKEIKEFSIGDSLVDLDDNLVEITEIAVVPNTQFSGAVYNLTVEPQHTFLVGSDNLWLRVHNGGGGKSSGSQAPRAAREAANTLKSSAIAKVIDVISHGEIEGIVGGAKGVLLNGTQLQADSGEYNFNNVFFDYRTGIDYISANQPLVPGFNTVENEMAFASAEVITSRTVELADSNVDQARVTITLSDGLWKQDTSNGDLNGYNVSYKIYVSDLAVESWSLAVDKTISGKTTSAYEIAHLVNAPAGAVDWKIKVERLSPADNASSKSKIFFSRITEIFFEAVHYNKVAYAALKIPAEEVGNNIPVRGYDVKGIKVKIPSNYNPVTRAYTGYWNMLFAAGKHWTDNTAWILYDLITNAEYGIQNFLGQTIAVDVMSFYEAAMYCDCVSWNGSTNVTNLIPNGEGGYEVRYRFNGVIATQQDAWQLLHAIASNMRALLVMKGNQISLIQDRPKTAVKIINNSNVVDGMFMYSSTESTSRTTAINCTFNDINDRYLPRTISEPSEATLAAGWYDNAHVRYGYNVKDVVAYGCVTEAQARRLMRHELYTEINQPELCSFTLGLNVINMMPGEVVTIMDNDYVSLDTEFYAGRAITASGTSITLDCEITLISGHTYTIGIMSPDYTSRIERTITTGSSITDTLTLSSALPAGDYTNHEWMLYSTGFVSPREFLILSITETSKGIYSVSCVLYDKNKYAAVDIGISVVSQPFSRIISNNVPAVTGIDFTEVFMNNGIASSNYIGVKWAWVAPTYVVGGVTKTYTDPVIYTIRWRRDGNPYKVETGIAVKSFQIPDTTPGVYEVTIEAVNMQGKHSVPTYSTYNYRTISTTSTLEPPLEFFVEGTAGVAFTDTFIPMSWKYNPANDTTSDTLLDYVLEIWSDDGLELLRTYVLPYGRKEFLADGVTPNVFYKGLRYTYNYSANKTDHGGTASRTVLAKLYSRDMVGDYSEAVIKTFTNGVPATQSFSIMSGLDVAYIRISTEPEADITGYRVWRMSRAQYISNGNSFSASEGNVVYDDVGRYITIDVPTKEEYIYKVAAYDSFGKTGLNLSSEISSTPLTIDAVQWSQSGIAFSIPSTNTIAWTAGTIYKNGTTIAINAGSAPWTSGKLYIYYPGTGADLATTGSLGIAVGAGTYPLATYTGGGIANLKGGDGSAFVSGSDIVAATVGANALVTGKAVITEGAQIKTAIIDETHIGSAAINNAAIKDEIHSQNFSNATRTGWKIDKTGNITSYGAFTLATAGTGASRLTIDGQVLKVFDSTGVVRVKLGNLSA